MQRTGSTSTSFRDHRAVRSPVPRAQSRRAVRLCGGAASDCPERVGRRAPTGPATCRVGAVFTPTLPGRCALALGLLAAAVATRSAGCDPPGPRVQSYVQLRVTDTDREDPYLAIRRLKLVVQGPWSEHGGYFAQLLCKDGNRSATDGLTLQELRLWRDVADVRVTLGMMKPPFGWERFTPDTDLAVPDRSVATDRLVPAGSLGRSFARDLGVTCEWRSGPMQYAVGVFDGAGAHNAPQWLARLLVARAVWEAPREPASAPAAHAEAAVAWRRARDLDFTGELPGSAAYGYDQFDGQDLRLDLAAGMAWERWQVRGEWLCAAFDPLREGSPAVTAGGWYVQGQGRFTRDLEAAVKWEAFDARHGVQEASELEQFTLGVNWYIRANEEKLQVARVFRHGGGQDRPSDLWQVQYQRFF